MSEGYESGVFGSKYASGGLYAKDVLDSNRSSSAGQKASPKSAIRILDSGRVMALSLKIGK